MEPRHDDFPNDYPEGFYEELSFRQAFKDAVNTLSYRSLWPADRKRAIGRV